MTTHNYKEKIAGKLSQLKSSKILVVGDVGIDQYVSGLVRRISPEAPVPVLEVQDEFYRLGLSTNVAANILSLGGQPVLLSVIGKDLSGGELKGLLRSAQISTDYLVEDPSRPTTRKMRVMSDMHHIVRVDYENSGKVSDAIHDKLFQIYKDTLPKMDAVILQDYAKGVLCPDFNVRLIAEAKKQKKMVFVDPHEKTPLEAYTGADLMTPNLKEAMALTKVSQIPQKDEEVYQLGKTLMKGIQSDRMVITRSREGMTLFEKGQTINVPTFARQVYDVTGAGDTVIAAICLAHSSGFSLEEACVFANFAAGVVVGKVGSATCTMEELTAYMNSIDALP